ncbi:integrin beta-2-like isoform X1 [Arapaima gigas]
MDIHPDKILPSTEQSLSPLSLQHFQGVESVVSQAGGPRIGRLSTVTSQEMCLSLYYCFLFLSFLVLDKNVLGKEECAKALVKSCADCIRSGPRCAWCKQLDFIKQGEPDSTRCDTEANLINQGCGETDIIFPKSNDRPLENKPLSKAKSSTQEAVQVKPQSVHLELRPGMPHTFQINFKRAEDYPVDLYYLMDLSYSMKDDLNNVKQLGQLLLETLKNITSRARIGFGSFVDKTVLPFTNTNAEQLKKPCPPEEKKCEPAFGFKHILSLTANGKDFNMKVAAQKISGNLDKPEGSLDAVMQSAVCGDEIGWGNSTRLLVLTTDDGFHMAGDGKLGSIFQPNDGKCHLDQNFIYNKNNEMDYPSVGQVANKLAENNIQTIFAVTNNVESVYMASFSALIRLKEIIPKSEVGVLSNDSSNVVSLIKNAYMKLSSNVILSHDELPDGVTVTYTSNCVGGEKPSIQGICNNVSIDQEVVFNVIVTAEKCMESKVFHIGPLGFREKTKVTMTTRCQCECDDVVSKNKKQCSGQGNVICGTCSCNPGFAGQKCECKVGDKDEKRLKEACRSDNVTECSGQGECVCGQCVCHAGADGRTIYGKYCECNDMDCEVHNNKLCGGNGKCHCDKCYCNEGYEGSACQCKTSIEACQKEPGGSVCSNRGKCVCNSCQCQRGYKLSFCEICPGCPSPCPASVSCIECLGFQKGPLSKNCSNSCKNIQYQIVTNLPTNKTCKERDSEGCWMMFSMEELDGFNNYSAKILDKRECPEPPNIGAIIGAAFAGVALIGLLIVLIIKAVFHYHYLQEYKKFEQEKSRATWSDNVSPMYKAATTTVLNPNYTGN